jgi:uncharacterized protein YjbI with pentapeptide repeats
MITELIIILVFVGLILALLVWWLIPVYMVRKFGHLDNDKERADVEDNYRKTIGQALGAVALIVTFGWTFYKDRDSMDQSRDQSAAQTKQFTAQQNQARDQFVNQQFIAAAGLLKEKAVGTRVAGLYALEQIASAEPATNAPQVTGTQQAANAKNPYLIPTIRAMIGFIKSSTESKAEKNPKQDWTPIAADTQSAVSILGHLNENHRIDIDLQGAYLVHADLKMKSNAFVAANFQGAKLYAANMSGLNLNSAMFGGSYMADWEAYGTKWEPTPEDYENTRQDYTVNFDGSMLAGAGFENVFMGGASLKGSCLAGAKFPGTDLSRVSFEKASMGETPNCSFQGNRAHFYQAVLIKANFKGVDIGGVNFGEANLSDADFSEALNVDKAIFKDACADPKAHFPASFDPKLAPCPHKK